MFLCANTESKATFLVTSGVCFALKESYEGNELHELNEDEVQLMMQEVPSIPFQVEFNIPVVQVMCGDMF